MKNEKDSKPTKFGILEKCDYLEEVEERMN